MRLIDKIRDWSRKAWTDVTTEDDGKTVTVRSFEDTTDIEEANKYIGNNFTPQDLTSKDGWRRIGSIPMSIYVQLEKEGIAKDPKAFRRWLRDPENRVWTFGRKI